MSSLLPPATCLQLIPRIGFSVPNSHCSSIFVECCYSGVLLIITHAFALSAIQLVHQKRSLRINTSTRMHSGGLELTQLTYSRHEDNLLHHRGDIYLYCATASTAQHSTPQSVRTKPQSKYVPIRVRHRKQADKSWRELANVVEH